MSLVGYVGLVVAAATQCRLLRTMSFPPPRLWKETCGNGKGVRKCNLTPSKRRFRRR